MKIINEHDFKIIMACKSDLDMTQLIDYLKEYLWLDKINYETIYYHLTKTIFNVLNTKQIESIYSNELTNIYLNNVFNKETRSFNYENLCELLFKQLMLLKIRDNDQDLYAINVNEKVYSYSEYLHNLDKKTPKKLEKHQK